MAVVLRKKTIIVFSKIDATFDEDRCHFRADFDAQGGTHDELNETETANLCLAQVMKYKKEHPDYGINGATWGTNSQECYAERGATKLTKYEGWFGETWHSCIFAGKAPVGDTKSKCTNHERNVFHNIYSKGYCIHYSQILRLRLCHFSQAWDVLVFKFARKLIRKPFVDLELNISYKNQVVLTPN